MNLNLSLLYAILCFAVLILIFIAVMTLKKKTHAKGAGMMLFSLIATMIVSIGLNLFEYDSFWLELAEVAISSMLFLLFCFGFYRFANCVIFQDKNVNNGTRR